MTSSAVAAPQGAQEPSVRSIPPYDASAGQEAVELCRMAGLELDPWEEFVLSHALGERSDGKWSAFEVGLCVPRQNGKTEILVARELVGLFLLGERLLLHSAHLFPTALEAFRRLTFLVENTPDFSRRVKRIVRSHGEEGVELMDRRRLQFKARTKGGGRGFSADCVIFDECMDLQESAHGAILPTLSARPNPQVWYAGSAVDQFVHDNGIVFASVRERGVEGKDESLAYFEWSAGYENPDVGVDVAEDREGWARANPGLGIRISEEHIAREQRSMDARTFAVERLGVGSWPRTDGFGPQIIGEETWRECADTDSTPDDPVCFAFDVAPDRSTTSIGVAGATTDGTHVEIVERGRGTGWVVDRLVELDDKHSPAAIICDGAGPAASLIEPLAERGIEVTPLSAKEYAQACGAFYDACDQRTIRHLDTSELNAAVRGAAQRPLGDAWAWSRKSSKVDISPLVATTLARWGVETQAASVYDERGVLAI